MATAMDSAIQDASKAIDTSSIGANTVQGLQMGMSLAQRQQDIEAKRQQIQFQQQQQEMQKGEWLHSQLSQVSSENDPKLRAALVNNLNDQYPKIFDGRRLDPTQAELLKKSPTYNDKIVALTRVRKAMLENNFSGMSDFDKQVVNGMSSADVSQQLGHLNTIQTQESAIVKALTMVHVATPQAAAQTGQSQSDLQQTLSQNNPTLARQQMVALRSDDQASKAGAAYDGALKKTYIQKQALDRATHTLTDPNTPITPQIFKESEKEFVTALTGSGATGIGQTEKTEYNDLHLKMAEAMQKYGNKMQDLRVEAPELVNQLQSSINRLSGAYADNMEETTSKVDSNFSQSSNPKVQEMRKLKTKDYAPKYHAAAFGQSGQAPVPGQPSQPGQNAQPGVNPGLAAIPQPAANKPTPSDSEQIEVQARERLRQVRAANKAGLPISYTEQQVKDTYKNLTGRELVQ
jgi:hypothetical protein